MHARNVLLTGPSGSGKTFFVEQLRSSAENIFDADLIPNIGIWKKNGKEVQFPANASTQWRDEHEYYWNREVLKNFLDVNKPVIVVGTARNAFDLADLFDKVFFLDIKPELLEKRLSDPSRKNLIGKTEKQRKNILNTSSAMRTRAKKENITFLDASLTPDGLLRIIQSTTS